MVRILSTLLFGLAVLLAPIAAKAQTLRLITDAETQSMIRDFSAPLMKAAGINNRDLPIYLVNDRRFNAFVIENGSLFINYGTIIDAKTPNAFKAVLAHEIGHLAGGHLQRLREQAEVQAKVQAVSMLLGVGVLAAAAGQENREDLGRMASAFIIGASSASQNAFMAYRRSEESAADAAAISYLERTKQSPEGLIDVLNTLKSNQGLSAGASGYLGTHPLAQDRINQVQNRASGSPFRKKRDSQKDIMRFELVKAKLTGFLERSQTVLNRYPNTDKSIAARYARTIAGYRAGAAASAVKQMAALANADPRNPNFQEMLGQMYYETGQPAKAIPPLKRAVELSPNEPEFRLIYALALADTGDTSNIEEAIRQLKRVSATSPKSPRPFAILARAYAKLGDKGQADLASAEAALLNGEEGLARSLAKKAQRNLTKGTPAWLRSDDILSLT
ncbi:M48 family metalloprotease [uncultured Maritalea sp.]|jgi:predicted Zn-dependent protease|uniref:M48 family metalloprotease n=1 Tax=uncultured Maritalea sp. TaxID=757249 RepID=UPI0026089E6D|nr:M48 family metalloprotease [uncultured Maritalea sp.]